MPAFYLLCFIAVILLWFASSYLFKPVGGIFYTIFKDAHDVMCEDEEEENY